MSIRSSGCSTCAKASGSRPRGEGPHAVSPQPSAPDVGEDAELRRLELVHVQSPRASPRRCGRGWPNPGAIETTTAFSPPGEASSNSRRSAIVLWWMCPARIRSAPASTRAASTWFRLRDRLLPRPPRRAEQMVVQSDDPVGAGPPCARSSSAARRTCSSPKPPGLVAPGPHKLRPTTTSVSRWIGSSSPRAARTHATGW